MSSQAERPSGCSPNKHEFLFLLFTKKAQLKCNKKLFSESKYWVRKLHRKINFKHISKSLGLSIFSGSADRFFGHRSLSPICYGFVAVSMPMRNFWTAHQLRWWQDQYFRVLGESFVIINFTGLSQILYPRWSQDHFGHLQLIPSLQSPSYVAQVWINPTLESVSPPLGYLWRQEREWNISEVGKDFQFIAPCDQSSQVDAFNILLLYIWWSW